MNQNRVIIIGGIGIVMLLLILAGVGAGIMRLRSQPLNANEKALITKLDYCGTDDKNPCVLSFTQDGEGNMLVNLFIPAVGFPNFYLVINRANEEIRYKCEKVMGFPNNVTCAGPEMFPGEVLQFMLIALQDETILAEGNFAILGLMLAAPESETLEVTETSGTTELTESATPDLLEIFTPIPLTTPSYPNPSYPNQ